MYLECSESVIKKIFNAPFSGKVTENAAIFQHFQGQWQEDQITANKIQSK